MKRGTPQSFTGGASAVLDAAQDEARALGYGWVSTEHLLLGLIREADGLVAEVLRSLGIGAEGARVQVQNVCGRGIQPPDSGRLPLTSLCRQVLELAADQARRSRGPAGQSPGQVALTERASKAMRLALREALRRGDGYVGTEHLLLALLDGDNTARRMLAQLGCDPAAIRALLRR